MDTVVANTSPPLMLICRERMGPAESDYIRRLVESFDPKCGAPMVFTGNDFTVCQLVDGKWCLVGSTPAMWEYRKVCPDDELPLSEADLDELGREGWELASHIYSHRDESGNGSYPVYIFKRLIVDEPADVPHGSA